MSLGELFSHQIGTKLIRSLLKPGYSSAVHAKHARRVACAEDIEKTMAGPDKKIPRAEFFELIAISFAYPVSFPQGHKISLASPL